MLKIEDNIKQEEIDLDTDLYPYHCKECSKKFQNIFEIKDHILKDHSLEIMKNYINPDIKIEVTSDVNPKLNPETNDSKQIYELDSVMDFDENSEIISATILYQNLKDLVQELRNKLKRQTKIIRYQRKKLREYKEKFPKEEKNDRREVRSSFNCTEPACKKQFAIWHSLTRFDISYWTFKTFLYSLHSNSFLDCDHMLTNVQGGAYVFGRFSSLKDLKSDPKHMPHLVH